MELTAMKNKLNLKLSITFFAASFCFSNFASANVPAAITALKSLLPQGIQYGEHNCHINVIYSKTQGTDGSFHPFTNVVVVPAGATTGVVFALSDTPAENNGLKLTTNSNEIKIWTKYTAHGSDAGHREQATVTYSLGYNKLNHVISVSANQETAGCVLKPSNF